MKKTFSFFSFLIPIFLLVSSVNLAIEPNQWDNFQGGTTQGWISGAVNPNPPVVVMNGGPSGAGDSYLLVTATGGQGAGGRLVTFNQLQWTGNYITSGVPVVSMHLNNFSNETLNIRFAISGLGGDFWSVTPAILSPQSGWQVVQFYIDSTNLTGGTDILLTLTHASEVRILHSVAGAFIGDPVSATLGIDNISAADNPLPVELVSFSAEQSGNKVQLNWITSSEINNHGFEVERIVSNPGSATSNSTSDEWKTIGFVNGNGSTTETKAYSFIDNKPISGKSAYRLKQFDYGGAVAYSPTVEVDVIVVIGFTLEQNYPNPFNPATVIRWQSSVDGWQNLKIYDMLGKEVASLVDEFKTAGSYEIEFSASGLSSGTYFYKLQAEGFSEIKKMTLLR